MSNLHYKVYTSSKMGFSVTSTLIYGEKEAVLIDSQMLIPEAKKVLTMIQETGKTLTKILITHAHLDHFGGTEVFTAAFPKAQVLAEAGVAQLIRDTGEKQVKDLIPMQGQDLAPTQIEVPEVFASNTVTLEGNTIEVIPGLQGDFSPHSAFYINALKMLVVGDIVYPGMHAWTSDTNNALRDQWIASLEKLATYPAELMITGHKYPRCPDIPQYIAEEIAYLKDFNAANLVAQSGQELMDMMLVKYPKLKSQGLLKIGAYANKKETVNTMEALMMG